MLESSFQWVEFTKCWAVIVWKIGFWFIPEHAHFVPLACKLCLSCSLETSELAALSLIDLQHLFWKHKFLCPTMIGYFLPLSHLLWRQNDKHFDFSCLSWDHWVPILILLRRRKAHFMFQSYSPMDVEFRRHLAKVWCLHPSGWMFC